MRQPLVQRAPRDRRLTNARYSAEPVHMLGRNRHLVLCADPRVGGTSISANRDGRFILGVRAWAGLTPPVHEWTRTARGIACGTLKEAQVCRWLGRWDGFGD